MREFYEKVGKRYKKVGIEFSGFPCDGVWLVEDGRNSLIMKVGDLIEPMPYAAMMRYSDDACKAYRELVDKGPFSPNDVVEVVCKAIALAREKQRMKKTQDRW